MPTFAAFESFFKDLRYACRMLWKTPGSTLVAVFALALGIGANSAIFSVVNGILLRPLEYPNPERLAILWEANPSKGINDFYASPADYRDWLQESRSWERIAAFRTHPSILTGGALPERLEAASATPGVFGLLGARTALGRTFLPDEDRPSHNHVAVLSYGLWQRRFGGDPSIVGRSLSIDGGTYQVVGVTDSRFRLLDTETEIWLPYTLDAKELKERGFHTLKVIARLKPGVSLGRARHEMQSIARNIELQFPDTNKGWTVNPVLVREQLVGNIRPTLFTLLGAVCFVLLIACSNVANLLLVRAGGRQKEVAVRTALGASQTRIVRQMLTESVLLALASGAAGLMLAWCGVQALIALRPADIPRMESIAIDAHVLLFTLAVAVATGLIFGAGPALTSTRGRVNDVLKAAGRSSMASVKARRTRSVLVVSEIALSVALLAGAGLMIRSFLRLQSVNPGFRPDHVLTMEVALPETQYKDARVGQFYSQLLGRIENLPGVQRAALTRNVPLSGGDPSLNFEIEHRPIPSGAEQPRAKYRAISGGYFNAMGIPVLKGRAFATSDGQNAPSVVIVNDTMARRFWPGEDPIGKRMKAGFDESPWSTIVGVVGNIKHASLDSETSAEMYYPYEQVPPTLMNFVEGSMTIVLRTAAEPVAMVNSVRDQVHSLDPAQPVFHVKTMEDFVHGSTAQPRFRALLLGVFAGVALLLAIVGLYGVISYSVAQRANEMGVRVALGAARGDLLRLVLGEGARMAGAGIAVGVCLALGLARAIAKLLYGIDAADPVTFIAIPILLLTVALLAAFVPAMRAARTDPAIVLRQE